MEEDCLERGLKPEIYSTDRTDLLRELAIINKHPLLLNTKIYYTKGGNISRGRRPSEIFATEGVINLVFNSRGCNIRFIMHLHRISGEKKI